MYNFTVVYLINAKLIPGAAADAIDRNIHQQLYREIIVGHYRVGDLQQMPSGEAVEERLFFGHDGRQTGSGTAIGLQVHRVFMKQGRLRLGELPRSAELYLRLRNLFNNSHGCGFRNYKITAKSSTKTDTELPILNHNRLTLER